MESAVEIACDLRRVNIREPPYGSGDGCITGGFAAVTFSIALQLFFQIRQIGSELQDSLISFFAVFF